MPVLKRATSLHCTGISGISCSCTCTSEYFLLHLHTCTCVPSHINLTRVSRLKSGTWRSWATWPISPAIRGRSRHCPSLRTVGSLVLLLSCSPALLLSCSLLWSRSPYSPPAQATTWPLPPTTPLWNSGIWGSWRTSKTLKLEECYEVRLVCYSDHTIHYISRWNVLSKL